MVGVVVLLYFTFTIHHHSSIIMKTYRINRFAEIEGSAATGWVVINLVTGLAQDATHPTFAAARDAANFLNLHYGAVERGY